MSAEMRARILIITCLLCTVACCTPLQRCTVASWITEGVPSTRGQRLNVRNVDHTSQTLTLRGGAGLLETVTRPVGVIWGHINALLSSGLRGSNAERAESDRDAPSPSGIWETFQRLHRPPGDSSSAALNATGVVDTFGEPGVTFRVSQSFIRFSARCLDVDPGAFRGEIDHASCL